MINEKHIEIKDLTIKYDEKIAVDNISLDIFQGDIVGYVGPNGSGKTTTIKAIMNLLKFEGQIKILGNEIDKNNTYKHHIGYVPENVEIFGGFKGEEFLIYYGGLQE